MQLNKLREKIDRLDLNLLDLVNERAALAIDIGKKKEQVGHPILDEKRERAILKKMAKQNPGPLPKGSILKIFKSIIEENRSLQEKLSPIQKP